MSILIQPSQDMAYFRDLLKQPRMNRALVVNGVTADIEVVLGLPSLKFFVAWDGPRRVGGVIFRMVMPEIAEIHVALTTVGRKTEDALRAALAEMGLQGAKLFVALIPKGHRALMRLAEVFGFRDAPQLRRFYPEWCADAFVFKDYLWR